MCLKKKYLNFYILWRFYSATITYAALAGSRAKRLAEAQPALQPSNPGSQLLWLSR